MDYRGEASLIGGLRFMSTSSSKATQSPLTREKALELSKHVANTISAALGERRVHSTKTWTFAAAVTAVTICDGLAGVIALVESPGRGHSPTIVRGMIESLLDLSLICKDWRNVARLTLASQRGTRRHLQMAMGQDGTLDDEFKQTIRDLLRDVSRTIKELEDHGVKHFDIEDKFRLANDYSALTF